MLVAARSLFPLYAFTNSNLTHQRVWATRYAAELSVFRSVFVSSELGLRKPDPAAYAAVAMQSGFSPSAMLFFDDSPENVEGARVAGLQTVLVKSVDDVRRALELLRVDVGLSDEANR